MRFIPYSLTTAVLFLSLLVSFPAVAEDVLYKADFEEIEIGEVPDDFLVLEGKFAVEEDQGNKILVLPGQPVGTFTTLMGPAEIEGNAIQVRIKADARKRRYPNFGVGLNGVSGYRLQINPTRRRLEFYREDVLEASSEYRWKSGEWTHLKLRVRKLEDGKWRVEGKAWKEGQDTPEEWSIAYEENEDPHTGRPSIWGIPYAENPIWFDDIQVTPAFNQ